jgi:hypothetical protein
MKLKLLALSLLVVAYGSCQGQATNEPARLPYASVFTSITSAYAGIKGVTNGETRFVLSSELPGVKPQDITLYIDSRSGKIPLQLNSDGTFTLPFNAELMKENPFIVANQPKGSLNLRVDLSISPDEKQFIDQRKARYSDLFSIKGRLDQIGDRLHREQGAEFSKSKALGEFRPSAPTYAPALIHLNRGDVRINPDKDGVIRIQYDSELTKENPWVTFPAKGNWKCQITTVDDSPKVVHPSPQ